MPSGFRFGAVAAGIKYRDRLDLAMAEAPAGAAAAVLFTTNRVKAAPLLVGARNFKKSRGTLRALIVNSGNANCATGKRGMRDCADTCARAAKLLACGEHQVLPSSTGVIGVALPAGRIMAALPQLVASLSSSSAGAHDFARAIMTTDTRPKMAGACSGRGANSVTLLGVAKGAGMIHPQMATMLAYIFTDIAARPERLNTLLAEACSESFNCISVDGDTSTNDTLALLASGASGVLLKGPAEREFRRALKDVCSSLAQQIVGDGEGIQHVVRLRIERSRSEREARRVAACIATSLLVKTAWAGADPNWGRILAAIGRSGIEADAAKIDIWFGAQQVCRRGEACSFDEKTAHRYMSQPVYEIRVSLGAGRASAWLLTNDLTAEYVRINADYRS
ncbi:MAG TPA: bifunctional glutamate N-acetyltransferase/amino-acid acetyltransferase ArgJ [Terriglobales bacterium]|nr:bifunctional glutamate N-acetyltransferase/amino-acid acetyltransferase ArgJ [Terriglobales bacterium]